jgi:Ca2+-binding EF-hand superfamily protein
MKPLGILSLAGLVATQTAMAQEMPGSALAILDSNRDAQVSVEEFKMRMGEFFTQIDANKSGQIDYSEVEGIVPKEVFDAADTNGNGRLSRKEYVDQTMADFANADRDGDTVLD